MVRLVRQHRLSNWLAEFGIDRNDKGCFAVRQLDAVLVRNNRKLAAHESFADGSGDAGVGRDIGIATVDQPADAEPRVERLIEYDFRLGTCAAAEHVDELPQIALRLAGHGM